MLIAIMSGTLFRAGVQDLISWSEKKKVPVLVFSAGLGESVIAALEAANYLLPNVKVITDHYNYFTIALHLKQIHTNMTHLAFKNQSFASSSFITFLKIK